LPKIVQAELITSEEEVAQLEAFPELCAAIKRMLDPKRILSPCRYGIG